MAIIITITVVALLFSGVLGFFIYLWKAESGHHIESINAIEEELRSIRESFETGIIQGQVPSDGAYNGNGGEEDEHRDEDPLAWARGDENPLAWVKNEERSIDRFEDTFREHDIIDGWEDGEDYLDEAEDLAESSGNIDSLDNIELQGDIELLGAIGPIDSPGDVNSTDAMENLGNMDLSGGTESPEDIDSTWSIDKTVEFKPLEKFQKEETAEYENSYEGGSSVEPWPFGYNQIPEEEFEEIEDEIPSILLYEDIPEEEFEPVVASESEDSRSRESEIGDILDRDNLTDLELESTINQDSGQGSINIIGYDVGRSGKKYTSDELETLILE